MKTNPYNKEEHMEGYVHTGDHEEGKSAVQQHYEQANDTDEVVPFGEEKSEMISGNPAARDGYDNSGTQGKDSLSDDIYLSTDNGEDTPNSQSHTGSSSKDFKSAHHQDPEDHALNSGI